MESSLTEHVLTNQHYGYSATDLDDLGATEYTLVTIAVDESGSVGSFKNEIEKSIQEEPFTIFGSKEIKDGVWVPFRPDLRQRFITYCEDLEASGRYPLCIWPPHCLIGSEGNNVLPVLYEALLGWEANKKAMVDYVSKGSNFLTEHYSAVKAEVPDPNDPTTQLNTRLIKTLMEADKILIAGEAGSHCVASTVKDIADGFQDDSYIKKMVLLEDGISPVISPYVDFPAIQAQFIADMKSRGMETAKTTDF